MFVNIRKSGAHQYVYVVQAYRNEQGKIRHQTIEKLGRLDLLEQKDPNFMENLKAKLKDQKNALNLNNYIKNQQQFENRLANEQSIKSIPQVGFPIFCYANILLFKIFDEILGLHYKLNYIEKKYKDKLQNYSLSKLIFHRIIYKLIGNSIAFNSQNYNLICDVVDVKAEVKLQEALKEIVSLELTTILKFLHKNLHKHNISLPLNLDFTLDKIDLKHLNASLDKSNFSQNDKKIFADIVLKHEKTNDDRALLILENVCTKIISVYMQQQLKVHHINIDDSTLFKALSLCLLTIFLQKQKESFFVYLKLNNNYQELIDKIFNIFGLTPLQNLQTSESLVNFLKLKKQKDKDIIGEQYMLFYLNSNALY